MYIRIKLENDKFFRKNNFPQMKSEVFTPENVTVFNNKRENYFSVSENTVRKTTVQSILDVPKDKKVTALNFANAMYAGGGYVLGGNAQEESLCRASMLYYTIKTQKNYYVRNRLHVLPDYTDTVIYSENVPVIRDDTGNILPKMRFCDFITVPAVNRTFAKFLFSENKINQKMYRRIQLLTDVVLMHSPEIIVFGAFGCGVFGNKRETVFKIFEETINNKVPDSIKVVFAVP